MKAIKVPKNKLHLSHDLNISTTHLCCRAIQSQGQKGVLQEACFFMP